MAYARILFMLITIPTVIYWVMCILQIVDIIRFTEHEIEIPKFLIPFYYLFKK